MTPLVTQISWTNHLLIMSSCKTNEEREFYIRLCIKENYSKRQLERQLDSGYYERYMLSSEAVLPKTVKKLGENPFLDSYVMEFLDLPNEYHENDLRKALIRNPDCCCFPPPRCLITLHQRKVEELKDIKKFMLEKMPFIDRVAFCIPTLI